MIGRESFQAMVMDYRPYMTQKGLADILGVTSETIRKYVLEMQGEIGSRYPDHVIAQPTERTTYISFAAFVDYITYRQRLLDRNLHKHVPPYDPKAILDGIGFQAKIIA